MKTDQIIKYYANSEQYGIIYDWERIAAEYNKLGIPAGYYNPLKAVENGARWNVAASVRSVGKTTAVLLAGMVLNKLYGTIICYVRNRADEIKKMNLVNLFAVVEGWKHGKYISDLTNGYYNSIYYRDKYFYYALRDETGNLIERMPTPFCRTLDVDEHGDYKSTLNLPLGDFIVWDEAIGDRYDDDFFKFCDLLKTIGRDRKSLYIFVLANTTNITAPLWREMMISKQLAALQAGHGRMCIAPDGSKIWVDFCDVQLKRERQEFNELYLGFGNPKLNAITGNETGWSFQCVPHIIRDSDKKVQNRDISISYHGELLAVNFMRSPRFGSFLEIHPLTKRRKVLFVLDDVYDKTECHGVPREIYNILTTFDRRNLIFYNDNLTGHLFHAFLSDTEVI